MSTKEKNLYGLLFGICVFLVALIVITIALAVENKKLKEEKLNVDNREIQLTEVVTRYVDAEKGNHVVVKENRVTPGQIKNGTAISQGFVDSLATALKLAKKDITESTQIIASLRGKLKGSVSRDSANNRTHHFKGPFLEASFTEKDSVLNYNYNAQLDITKYNKKKWWLGKRHYYQDISAKDPNMMIEGVRSYTVAQGIDTRRFGVGLQIGYYYDPVSGGFRPSVGAGLSYNILTF